MLTPAEVRKFQDEQEAEAPQMWATLALIFAVGTLLAVGALTLTEEGSVVHNYAGLPAAALPWAAGASGFAAIVYTVINFAAGRTPKR